MRIHSKVDVRILGLAVANSVVRVDMVHGQCAALEIMGIDDKPSQGVDTQMYRSVGKSRR
ncbi:hypothetical protein D3C85_1452620 [compost metagenome]